MVQSEIGHFTWRSSPIVRELGKANSYWPPQGRGGFGYDPLFIPDGFAQSFGELEAAVKHRISHRGAALRAARAAWPIFH